MVSSYVVIDTRQKYIIKMDKFETLAPKLNNENHVTSIIQQTIRIISIISDEVTVLTYLTENTCQNK